MSKTQFLQIRLSPEDRDRVERVASAEHLEPSTWARRVLLLSVDAYEARNPAPKPAGRKASPK